MAKKPTIKELDGKISMLALNLNTTFKNLDSIAWAFTQFTKFMGKHDEFKKYLENLQKVNKLKENDEKTKKTKV